MVTDIDVPLPQDGETRSGPDDFPILIWAWRRLPELGERTGQLRVPESIARPLIEAGLVQEWSATDGNDLKWIEPDTPPPGNPQAQMTVAVRVTQPNVFEVSFGGGTDTVEAEGKFIVRDNGDETLADVSYPQPAGTTRQEAAGLLDAALQPTASIDATKNGALLTIRGAGTTVVGYVAGSLTLPPAPEPPPEPPPAPAPETPPPPPVPAPGTTTPQPHPLPVTQAEASTQEPAQEPAHSPTLMTTQTAQPQPTQPHPGPTQPQPHPMPTTQPQPHPQPVVPTTQPQSPTLVHGIGKPPDAPSKP